MGTKTIVVSEKAGGYFVGSKFHKADRDLVTKDASSSIAFIRTEYEGAVVGSKINEEKEDVVFGIFYNPNKYKVVTMIDVIMRTISVMEINNLIDVDARELTQLLSGMVTDPNSNMITQYIPSILAYIYVKDIIISDWDRDNDDYTIDKTIVAMFKFVAGKFRSREILYGLSTIGEWSELDDVAHNQADDRKVDMFLNSMFFIYSFVDLDKKQNLQAELFNEII